MRANNNLGQTHRPVTEKLHLRYDSDTSLRLTAAADRQTTAYNRTVRDLWDHPGTPLQTSAAEGDVGLYTHLLAWREDTPELQLETTPSALARGGIAQARAAMAAFDESLERDTDRIIKTVTAAEKRNAKLQKLIEENPDEARRLTAEKLEKEQLARKPLKPWHDKKLHYERQGNIVDGIEQPVWTHGPIPRSIQKHHHAQTPATEPSRSRPRRPQPHPDQREAPPRRRPHNSDPRHRPDQCPREDSGDLGPAVHQRRRGNAPAARRPPCRGPRTHVGDPRSTPDPGAAPRHRGDHRGRDRHPRQRRRRRRHRARPHHEQHRDGRPAPQPEQGPGDARRRAELRGADQGEPETPPRLPAGQPEVQAASRPGEQDPRAGDPPPRPRTDRAGEQHRRGPRHRGDRGPSAHQHDEERRGHQREPGREHRRQARSEPRLRGRGPRAASRREQSRVHPARLRLPVRAPRRHEHHLQRVRQERQGEPALAERVLLRRLQLHRQRRRERSGEHQDARTRACPRIRATAHREAQEETGGVDRPKHRAQTGERRRGWRELRGCAVRERNRTLPGEPLPRSRLKVADTKPRGWMRMDADHVVVESVTNLWFFRQRGLLRENDKKPT